MVERVSHGGAITEAEWEKVDRDPGYDFDTLTSQLLTGRFWPIPLNRFAKELLAKRVDRAPYVVGARSSFMNPLPLIPPFWVNYTEYTYDGPGEPDAVGKVRWNPFYATASSTGSPPYDDYSIFSGGGVPLFFSSIDIRRAGGGERSRIWQTLWHLGPRGICGRGDQVTSDGHERFNAWFVTPGLPVVMGEFVWSSAHLSIDDAIEHERSKGSVDLHGPALGLLGYVGFHIDESEFATAGDDQPTTASKVNLNAALSGLLWATAMFQETEPGERTEAAVHGPLWGVPFYLSYKEWEDGANPRRPGKPTGATRLVGLGSLWMDYRTPGGEDSDGTYAAHGPLWGIVGWGRKDSRPAVRVLWYNIAVGGKGN
ncbi:MAG: hypothetical protein RLY93_10105 [Sumerlaeia bacterium]